MVLPNVGKVSRLFQNSSLPIDILVTSDTVERMHNINRVKMFKDPGELCDDCRWLVKTAESLDYLQSEESDEEELEVKNTKANRLNSSNSKDTLDTTHDHNYDERQVQCFTSFRYRLVV